jgi:hypothetical protein
VLETEKDGEKDWNLVVETVEGCFVLLAFPVQGPDVGGYEVEVVL